MAFNIIPTPVATGPSDSSAESKESTRQVRDLRDQLDRLHLITEALWTLLQRQLQVDESELAQIVEELDLRDGKLNGKAAPVPDDCPSCMRPVSVRTNICLYCGTKVEKSGVF